MKRDEAFELAIQWRDTPTLLVGDLRAAFDWLLQNTIEPADVVAKATGVRVINLSLVPEAVERFVPLHKALQKYAILLKTTKLSPDLFAPLIQCLAAEEPERITLTGLSAIAPSIEAAQRWVDKNERMKGAEGHRSEILKTSIELASDDELLVNTDQDGSLKLRGSTNIPMFLAFFRTPKHHLSVDAFLDIDRTVKATNLDRHRVRLSCKLHDVLIEIVSEKDGYRMQKFR